VNAEGELALTFHPFGVISVRLTSLIVAGLLLGRRVVTVNVEPGWTTGGPLSAKGCSTTTTADPVTPPTVAGIVATPAETAFNVPVALTVATF